jgi:glycosyltransferase involved in cell wall biosynthesis
MLLFLLQPVKLSIIIPVYNEAPTLEELLNQVWSAHLPAGISRELIIVDNDSSDGSYGIARLFAETRDHTSTHEVKIFQCLRRGKGNAVQMGFQWAGGDIFMIQDADLEYDTRDYPQLLEPILEGRSPFVLGSRHLAAGDWKIRRFENRPVRGFLFNCGGLFFHGLFNLFYGVRLTDPTTMYKVFHRKCLSGLSFQAQYFDFDYELLGKLIRAGFTPLEVPVSYRSRGFDEGKKINVWRDPWTWIWAILKFRFSPLNR